LPVDLGHFFHVRTMPGAVFYFAGISISWPQIFSWMRQPAMDVLFQNQFMATMSGWGYKYVITFYSKPTRSTNVTNLFCFGMTHYMFRTVFPSIIRSSRLYIQQQAFVKQILLFAC
jgi:hypothetical protein